VRCAALAALLLFSPSSPYRLRAISPNVLQTGRTVLEGKAADLENNEHLKDVYLGLRSSA